MNRKLVLSELRNFEIRLLKKALSGDKQSSISIWRERGLTYPLICEVHGSCGTGDGFLSLVACGKILATFYREGYALVCGMKNRFMRKSMEWWPATGS